jgi:ABC-2 type transport system ATP-binding protein
MSAAPAIEMAGVEKSYGKRQVLRGLDLEVCRGEVLCVLGPNGTGKTTTLEILEGFRAADAGTVRVLGMSPAGQPRALRERIGVVLQECGFPRHLQVCELLDSWRSYYPQPRPLAELLELVELSDHKTTKVQRLSGGQKRRLDFALALAGDPELIFLDEPTTGFDPEARRRCWTAIENLRTLGKTVVLTTHYLDEAERLADRVAILARGRIQMVDSPPQLAVRAGARPRVSFALPAAVRAGAAPLPDGLGLSVSSDEVSGFVDDPTAVLEVLLRWIDHHGLGGLKGLAVVPPQLEDVYLQLVASPTADPR